MNPNDEAVVLKEPHPLDARVGGVPPVDSCRSIISKVNYREQCAQ
jgi:hypothetical protein